MSSTTSAASSAAESETTLIIVYTPEGGEVERYDARKLLSSEASIVARTVDMRWPEIKARLVDDDLDAMRGVVWVMKKRTNPTLRFGDFDPGVDEMVTRFDQREVTNYVTEILNVKATDEDREGALRELERNAADPDAAAILIKEMTDGGPKAVAVESPTSTSSEPTT